MEGATFVLPIITQILPLGIFRFDQCDFLGSGPSLDPFLVLDCFVNVTELIGGLWSGVKGFRFIPQEILRSSTNTSFGTWRYWD